MTDQVRNPFFARVYARMTKDEKPEQLENRRAMLAGLRGRVVEIGAGNGANFPHYPPTVDEIVAVEPEPTMREGAQRAAADAGARIEVVDALGDALPFEDASFDAAVACLVLCSVPDQARTLAELHRVVRPGGELRFYEHVHAHRQPGRALLELADRSTIWPRLLGGCHPTRETADAISSAGFQIEDCRRFAFAPERMAPPLPHILGTARRT